MRVRPIYGWMRGDRTTSYVIGDNGWSITCARCGLTSYNINDVVQRYCGNCHRFHEDEEPSCTSSYSPQR
jgi:ribosomal protein L37E